MTGQASWLVILAVIAVIAGIAAFWLRERLAERRDTRHRHP
jgi:HAMP domain-containing protein